jgi:NADH-quinone oxidoreductase subunit M
MSTLLLYLLAIPLLTAAVVAARGPAGGPFIRWCSLGSTLASLVLAVVIAADFAGPRIEGKNHSGPTNTFQPELTYQRLLVPLGADREGTPTGIQFYVGIDGLNVWLVLLTALLMVTGVLVSWTSITERVNEFYAWMLILQLGMEGLFLSFDIILFYVFFELTLVPLFFLIGIWGGPQRQYAARKFFIYTFAGSLITLLGALGIVVTLASEGRAEQRTLTFSIPKLVTLVGERSRQLPADVQEQENALARVREQLAKAPPGARDSSMLDSTAAELQRARDRLALWRNIQFWVFAAMMVGFAVKVPMFPVHTWLPLAHTEAPTAGSVLLAGVLLKLGSYGFLRLCLPLAPDAAVTFGAPLLGSLAVVGILYGAFCALAQDDIKKMVAYSSVSHLGYCMLGLFALNEVGLTGGLLQMINHGLSTGALFLLVGMLYERYHTRRMGDYGGMAARLHLMGVFFVFITMTSIGLPGLNGFVGELLVLMGMYDLQTAKVYGPTLTGFSTLGVVLSAWYMLTMLRRVFFGEVKEPQHAGHGAIADLNGRELSALVPIAGLCLLLGVYPKPFLDSVRPEIQVVGRIVETARYRAAIEPAAPAPQGQTAHATRERPQ